jgi:hypothetical protein
MPLPPKVQFYDKKSDAELDQLMTKVAEDEKLSEALARLKFMVKVRSDALKQRLAESGLASSCWQSSRSCAAG